MKEDQHLQHNDAPTGSVTEKVHRPPRQRNPIQQAADLTIKAMLLQGTSIRTIAKALHLGTMTVQRAKARLLATDPGAEDLKSSLMSPHLGEMSVAVVEHFLKKGAKLKVVKGSDAMAAVKAVADRHWPVQQSTPPIPRISFVLVNVDVARSDLHLAGAALDVSPATEPDPTTSGNGSQPPGS
jgi:hypothetical protein